MSTSLVWFRRDLRLHDHPALHRACAEHASVIPVFVVDDVLTAGRALSAPRLQFLWGCVDALDEALGACGSGLVLRRGHPESALAQLIDETRATAVYWTSDVSPYARRRDRSVRAMLAARGVDAVPCTGTYARDVSKVRKPDGSPYTVFTPFWKAWERTPARDVLAAPVALPPLPDEVERGVWPAGLPATKPLARPICSPGEAAARAALDTWLAGPIDGYADRHDDLTGGTSLLSSHLRWGCLSARECEARARARATPGALAWVRQLAWREFYAAVLLAFPETPFRELQPKFRVLEWDDDPEALDAWRRGETGYPLVDAGMRQLAATGWMHNRARMVVGSFLTKDLHLDWRHGERHFSALLLDGEPAQNAGNWQWIASTGVDPAPYFRRIFNPMLQQEKFDPDGRYVRRWVPEMGAVPVKQLAQPWRMTAAQQRAAGCHIGLDYPAPIVDHAQARQRAIERYRAAIAAAAPPSRARSL